MSDLISRKAVYDMLHGLGGCGATDEWAKGWDRAIDTAIDGLGNIPTAYDVDEVISELKSHNNAEKVATAKLYNGEHRYYRAVSVTKAIRILKGAVKDE